MQTTPWFHARLGGRTAGIRRGRRQRLWPALSVVVLFGVTVALTTASLRAQRPAVAGPTAGVSTGHPLTSAAAFETLLQGGNAFDAGVTALLVGGVVEQDLYGLGGEALILVYPDAERKVTSIVGQGWAPHQASIEWYRSRNRNLNGEGLDPAVVPGALHGALTVLEPLQNHLRSSVPDIGQVETDEVYVGIERTGCQYVIPVQAKGGNDTLHRVQIEQDIALCAIKFPNLVCLPVAAQFMPDEVVALFSFEASDGSLKIADEKHYKLVPPEDLTEDDLRAYAQRHPRP